MSAVVVVALAACTGSDGGGATGEVLDGTQVLEALARFTRRHRSRGEGPSLTGRQIASP